MALTAALSDSDPQVRVIATMKLGEDHHDDAAPAIESALSREQDLHAQVGLSRPFGNSTMTRESHTSIEIVADPAEQPWTHILLWNSDDWILQRAGEAECIELGWTLTAKSLQEHVPSGAKVWVNLPPSQELGGRLELHDPNSMVRA